MSQENETTKPTQPPRKTWYQPELTSLGTPKKIQGSPGCGSDGCGTNNFEVS